MTHHVEIDGWVTAATAQTGADGDVLVTSDLAATLPGQARPRGILAAVAQDCAPVADHPGQARAAALAVSGLADGYYHARPTFGRGQALAQAAEALNRWMFASHGQDATQTGLSASLSALVLNGSQIGLLQIGAGLILRLRAGDVTRMTQPQLLRLPKTALAPRRALGHDSHILLDYQEDTVLAGDRYILLSDIRGAESERIDTATFLAFCRDGHRVPGETFARSLAQCAPSRTGGDGPRRSVAVLDIGPLPEPGIAATESALSGLPLGPIPQEGETLDGYQIGRTLHRGAYTLLKYAVDRRTRDAVVLKLPLPAMLNDLVFQAGFARESWIGTSIHSPVVGRILPVEPGRQSQLYIVMPYYAGETLESRIRREARLPLPEIAAIGLQLTQAVEDLRAVQVLHRDLKPENIILLNGGGLRLLDLGLAYLAGTESDTAQGLAGTLRYMAPDVLRGGAPDDRSELYALGIILYRMAAQGRFPRPGADVAAALSRERPDLPPALGAAIAAALETDPSRRPAHAGALGRLLSDALQAGAPPPVQRRRLARQRIAPITLWRYLALVLGLALLASIALR